MISQVYLMAPSSTADLQMIFTLGDGSSIYRYWKIRIALLPCSSNNLGTLNIEQLLIVLCCLRNNNLLPAAIQLRSIACSISRKVVALCSRSIGGRRRPQRLLPVNWPIRITTSVSAPNRLQLRPVLQMYLNLNY